MEIPDLNSHQLLDKWKHVIEQTTHVFSWTSYHELAFLCEVASQAKSICEIGSYHGKSALCMALANPKAKILCIDNCENTDVEETFGRNLLSQIASGQVKFVKGTSDWLWGDEEFDLCFIDAGHQFDDVKKDIGNLRLFMPVGSLMTGHDWRVNNPLDGVNRGVEVHFAKHRINVFHSIWHVKL